MVGSCRNCHGLKTASQEAASLVMTPLVQFPGSLQWMCQVQESPHSGKPRVWHLHQAFMVHDSPTNPDTVYQSVDVFTIVNMI